jgi:hypothetical protein
MKIILFATIENHFSKIPISKNFIFSFSSIYFAEINDGDKQNERGKESEFLNGV